MSDIFDEKYRKALSATALLVTDEMLRQAKGNKMIAIFVMPAMDFLKLTTTKEYAPEQVMQEGLSLADYNRFAESGNTIIMPYLKIQAETGRVRGHEGRHRAASLVKELGPEAKLKVAMLITRDGISRYYTEVRDPKTYASTKTYLGIADVPHVLKGEFRPRTKVTISDKGAVELWR